MSSPQPDSVYYRSLPRSPDLDHLKEEAKALKKQIAKGDAEALAFVQFHQRAVSGLVKSPLQLASIQFALARSYGFKSWPRLKAFVESQALSPPQRAELLLKTLFTDNFALLQELYERRDTLASKDIFLAAAFGDVATVESLLSSDPSNATRIGGPMQTQAITYATHSRFGLFDASYNERQRCIVQLLLAHGADPNSFVQEEGRGKDEGKLSSLYGCCRYPGNPAVLKLLLDAGANTDDGESLYHASELTDTACLELLFTVGVPEKDREFCIRRALDQGNRKAIEIYLKNGTDPNHLDWALFRQHPLEIVQLLIDYGANVNAPCESYWLLERIRELTPIQIAERNGNLATVDYLLAKGANDNRTPRDKLIGACARVDEGAVRDLLVAHRDVIRTMNDRDHGYLAAFARAGKMGAVRLMLDAGFDIEARADDLDATALLYAAGTGHVAMIRLLIAREAKLEVKHKYDGTPLDTCVHCAAHFRSPLGDYAESARCLIEAGDTVTDAQLEFAIEYELDDIAEVLKAHGATL